MSRTNLLDITVRSRSNSMDDIPWKKRLQFVGHGRTRKSSPSNSDSSSGGPTSSSALEGFPGESSPAIVHCVSGAHESGVYLLVEVLIHCLEHNLDVDISKTLSMLRQQRMCLIKTIEQYRFVYSTIACYLQKSRLI
ncbi:hypothetical protein AB6A40_009761 [Gnathostoma spinigerum]|uniref:Uncharacterized protein n=1 Tax=Gnathostoma spinigerum TaxID=75299 RepID=A0ABD6EVC2_9BILA